MTDWRALCAELAHEVEQYAEDRGDLMPECADRARAALAAEPAPPAEGEVAELVARLRRASDGASAMGWEQDSWIIARAADLLEQRHPAPVPVSERLPGPEDCDGEGRCWLHLPDLGTEPLWRLTDPSMRSRYHSHWLPFHALPLPAGEGQS